MEVGESAIGAARGGIGKLRLVKRLTGVYRKFYRRQSFSRSGRHGPRPATGVVSAAPAAVPSSCTSRNNILTTFPCPGSGARAGGLPMAREICHDVLPTSVQSSYKYNRTDDWRGGLPELIDYLGLMKKTIPTIRDVAAAAGVSTATVSKYVNGAQRFSPAVEATIKAVIADLGYRSNPLAQSMITGKTKTIGLSVLDVSNPHFTSIIKGANRVALAHGYTLLLVDTDENADRERPLLEALSRRVDGMIVFSRMQEADMGWMVEMAKPMVFFGRLSTLKLPTVSSDDFRGAYMVTQHLVALGHKRMAYLGFSRSRRDAERMGGVRACLDANALPLTVFDANDPSALEGERVSSAIMLGAAHPDALICYNDLMALGFMKEAQILGFRVPADISVAGFDNIQFGRYTSPPLTTVDLQSERMGVAAMEKLLATIEGKPTVEATTIEPQLILRSSTVSRR
jgi:LacI family transcriptional regulator